MPTDPPTVSDDVRLLLAPDSQFMTQLLPIVRANITISIAADPDHPDQAAYEVVAPFPTSWPSPVSNVSRSQLNKRSRSATSSGRSQRPAHQSGW